MLLITDHRARSKLVYLVFAIGLLSFSLGPVALLTINARVRPRSALSAAHHGREGRKRLPLRRILLVMFAVAVMGGGMYWLYLSGLCVLGLMAHTCQVKGIFLLGSAFTVVLGGYVLWDEFANPPKLSLPPDPPCAPP